MRASYEGSMTLGYHAPRSRSPDSYLDVVFEYTAFIRSVCPLLKRRGLILIMREG